MLALTVAVYVNMSNMSARQFFAFYLSVILINLDHNCSITIITTIAKITRLTNFTNLAAYTWFTILTRNTIFTHVRAYPRRKTSWLHCNDHQRGIQVRLRPKRTQQLLRQRLMSKGWRQNSQMTLKLPGEHFDSKQVLNWF